MQIE